MQITQKNNSPIRHHAAASAAGESVCVPKFQPEMASGPRTPSAAAASVERGRERFVESLVHAETALRFMATAEEPFTARTKLGG